MLSIIGAMAQNRVIGKQNQLPWQLPIDLAYFKTITLGKTVVMGRKTYQSIGKALPGRTNIVLSSDPDFRPADCLVLRTIDQVMRRAFKEEIFVIGGARIFQRFMPYAGRLYLTLIEVAPEGDAFFPEVDAGLWQLVSHRHFAKDETNRYNGCFLIYERKMGLLAFNKNLRKVVIAGSLVLRNPNPG